MSPLRRIFKLENIVAAENEMLVTLTADIVSAHVSNNSVATGEVRTLIENVFRALQTLGAPATAPDVGTKPKGAVSVRASIKPDHLVSMIDGKPYKMLKRHLSLHGYTPESYREAFGLPRDYPMVSAVYAEKRRALAVKIGLGRKPKQAAAAPASTALKPPRKPRTKKAALG
jgi:predicted transcriptional regulator